MSVSLTLSSSFVDVVLCFRIKSGGRMVRTRSQSNRIALRIHLNYYTSPSLLAGRGADEQQQEENNKLTGCLFGKQTKVVTLLLNKSDTKRGD